MCVCTDVRGQVLRRRRPVVILCTFRLPHITTLRESVWFTGAQFSILLSPVPILLYISVRGVQLSNVQLSAVEYLCVSNCQMSNCQMSNCQLSNICACPTVKCPTVKCPTVSCRISVRVQLSNVQLSNVQLSTVEYPRFPHWRSTLRVQVLKPACDVACPACLHCGQTCLRCLERTPLPV